MKGILFSPEKLHFFDFLAVLAKDLLFFSQQTTKTVVR